MGRQNGQTSVDERKLIIKHFDDGKSLRQISEIVFRSYSTVRGIVQRYKTTGEIKNKTKKAHNKVFLESDERYIVREVKTNPFLSAPKLAERVRQSLGKTVTAQTIRNVLHRANLNGRIARNKPFISKANQKKRLQFAREHRHKDFEFWKNVLFTDESKFNIFGSDGKVCVWRKAN